MRQAKEPLSAGAVLGWLVLAALAPGAAHLRAGRRRTGLVLISLYAVLLLALLAFVLTNDLGDLAGSATRDSSSPPSCSARSPSGWPGSP
ncbi:hypothetical protein ACFQQB_04460 [Nonomuraea rubra]|uniref:hypothetical protein n=1 Tax=Nonomuraea rubra TaxID=46180 RepID=UPI0036112671